MKAQVLYGINDLRYIQDYNEPELHPNEVLVKVKACGICGSDVDRVLKNGTYHFPTIIGHEFSGEVVKAYDQEDKIWIGKRVSVFPLIPCKKCTSCKKGDYQLCESYNYLGSRCDGGFAEYVAVPAWNLLEIPEDISFEEAAMLEPSSVALHALKISGNILGKNVILTGTGTITSILSQLCVAGGASTICIIGRNQEKLNYIKERVPQIKTASILDADFERKLLNENKSGFDIIIEGTGAANMLALSMRLISRKGVIVTMGNPSSDVILSQKDFWQLLRKELSIKGTWNSSFGIENRSDWKNIFELLVNKQLNLKSLISHRLKLSELMDGIQIMKNKNQISNKVMVIYE